MTQLALIKDIKYFFYISFIFLLIYFISINFIYFILAIASQRRNIYRIKQANYADFDSILKSFLTIPVSIIVSAFNEGEIILDNIYSSLNLKYSEFEVIMVNDGSNDNTLDVVKKEFKLYPVDYFYKPIIKTAPIKTIYRSRTHKNLLVIDKVKSNRADSINAAINTSKYRYICATDADSIFNPDGMMRLMRPVLLDPGKIVAIGGQLRIANGLSVCKGTVEKFDLPRKIVPAIQIIEYLRAFIANRLGWSSINAQMVISGAFGLWRKDAIIKQNGFSTDTTHEDIEMTFNLHHYYRLNKQKYAIISMPDPVTWTEVPNTLGYVFKQRERWQRVVNEVLFKYKMMFLNPRYGTVGLLSYPYYSIYEALGPFIEIFGHLLVIIGFILGILNIYAFALFVVISVGLNTLISLFGLFLEQYDFNTYTTSQIPMLILLALLEPLWFRQFIDFARMYALINFIKGKKGWVSPARVGYVKS